MFFLSGCVPNLQLDLFSFDVDHSSRTNISFYIHLSTGMFNKIAKKNKHYVCPYENLGTRLRSLRDTK